METALKRISSGLPWRLLLFGAAGLLLVVWLAKTPGGLLGKADAIGYAVCHRIDVRSFHIGERQVPLCARCSGMYLGALLGIGYQFLRGRPGRMPGFPAAILFGFFLVAFVVDGANSYLHFFPNAPGLYQPQNLLRLITGTGMGLSIASVLVPAFNQTIWSDWQPVSAFGSWRPVAELLVLAAIVDLLMLSGSPLILYPLALLSASGVMVMLGMIYTMIWVMVFRADNRYHKLAQLVVPLVGGFTTALLQIAIIDLARLWFTGTWQGFQL